jgi:hypothetical protein
MSATPHRCRCYSLGAANANLFSSFGSAHPGPVSPVKLPKVVQITIYGSPGNHYSLIIESTAPSEKAASWTELADTEPVEQIFLQLVPAEVSSGHRP